MIKRLEHVSVVVKDLDAAIRLWEALLGVKASSVRVLPTARLSKLDFPDGAYLELVEPVSPESASAQFLAKHGEGIHHIGFEVDDTDAELARCAEVGAELITLKSRPALDYLIGFLRPSPGSGVTIEFLQKVK